MGKFDDVITHHRRVIADMRSDVTAMENGTWCLWENTGAGRVDITAKWTEELKRRVAELERIVAAYEAINA